MTPALKFIVGWVVIIIFLAIVNKTALGHKILYYFLWLAFVSLVVVNYRFFADLFNQPNQGQATRTSLAVESGIQQVAAQAGG